MPSKLEILNRRKSKFPLLGRHFRVSTRRSLRGTVNDPGKRRVRTTIPEPSGQKYLDLLKRDFTAERPNRRYVGDITYLPLADGTNLYLATVIDCYSRRLAGWAIADHMRTELVEDALNAAAATRGSLKGAIFHSDHGSVYCSKAYATLCRKPRQERRNLGRTHFPGMFQLVKPDEPAYPVDIGFLGSYAVMLVPNTLTHLIKQAHRFKRWPFSRLRPHRQARRGGYHPRPHPVQPVRHIALATD